MHSAMHSLVRYTIEDIFNYIVDATNVLPVSSDLLTTYIAYQPELQ